MSKYSDLLVLRISEFDMNRIHHLEVLPTCKMTSESQLVVLNKSRYTFKYVA